MKGLKILIILIVAALLAFLIYKGVQKYKRKKLAEALTKYAETKGVKIDEKALVNSFDRLTDFEIDQLINFAENAQKNKTVAILLKLGTILPILKKINYAAVIEKM